MRKDGPLGSVEGLWCWCLQVEYDGAGFAGWQRQPGQRTVQEVLEDAVKVLFGHEAVVRASGRTDAGVHAVSQIAAVTVNRARSADEVREGLNANLPQDVAVVRADPARPNFDPRHAVVFKQYEYTILNRRSRSPMFDHRSWHVRQQLDVESMQLAANYLLGEHDFSAFRASGCVAAHPVRRIQQLTVERKGDLVVITACGHGFLRYMVRIIAATLVEVGLRRRQPEWVREVLLGRKRAAAGRTAPAQGLCLSIVEVGAAQYSHESAPGRGA